MTSALEKPLTNDFNTDLVLREIIAMLQKHGLPVNTVALDVSLLTPEFERLFPQIKGYKAGLFYRALEIDNIPATLRIQRRLEFDDIVAWLEDAVLPFVTEMAEELQQTFPGIVVKFQSRRVKPDPHWKQRRDYYVRLECRLDDILGTPDNVIQLSVDLSQFDGASYPQITAAVAWLLDEEGDGDWGIEIVSSLFPDDQTVSDGILDILETKLPVLCNSLEAAITERLQR